MSNIIHLNNAGAALQPEPVLHAVIAYLHLEAEMGGYEAADQQAEAIAGFYTSVAELIGAKARNIAFATSATDAYARALSSIHWQKGDILLTTENDYVSNQIAFLALQDRYDIRLLRARDTSEGGVDVADFEALIKAYQPRLAAVTHVPTNSGLIQDVISIGQICRTHEVLYLVDGCQSAGQMVLDMDQIGCDFFSATMRKFMRGPRGSGFLFVSDRVLEAGLMMDLPDMKGASTRLCRMPAGLNIGNAHQR
jgi:selenocysteine lyase/cysteine desulfurase